MILKAWAVVGLALLVLVLVVGMWPMDELVVASEIEVLIQPYADVLGSPSTISFSGADLYVWWGNDALVLRRNEHWYIAGITARGGSQVPPLFVALVIQAMREKERLGMQEVQPIAPWSVTALIPEQALNPEQR